MAREERQRKLHSLLRWSSDVSGLPITCIEQCQNGALFCIITAMACSPNDLQLAQVNYEARTESQCRENFYILQKLAKAARVGGLNHSAGIHSWLRMIRSKTDTQHYLKLLHKSLQRLSIQQIGNIEPEATPPPAPCVGYNEDLGDVDMASRQSSLHGSLSGTSEASSSGSVAFSPFDFGHRMPSGSLELELQRQASLSDKPAGKTIAGDLGSLHRNNSLFPSNGDESPPARISSASSLSSSLEAFMFPDNVQSLNDALRQSLDPRGNTESFVSPYSVARAPARGAGDLMSSGSTEAEGFKLEGFMDMQGGNGGRNGSRDVMEMIQDLDEMIAALDMVRKGSVRNSKVKTADLCQHIADGTLGQKGAHAGPAIRSWDDVSDWVQQP